MISIKLQISYRLKEGKTDSLLYLSCWEIIGEKKEWNNKNGFEAWMDTILKVLIAPIDSEFSKGQMQYTPIIQQDRILNNK